MQDTSATEQGQVWTGMLETHLRKNTLRVGAPDKSAAKHKELFMWVGGYL
jgi:hypothetical protein